MHYFKQLASALSLGLFLTVETAFHATPPANAQPKLIKRQCVVNAVAYAANMDAELVAGINDAPDGPVAIFNVSNYLQTVGFDRPEPRRFRQYWRMMRFLRENVNDNTAYLVAWTGLGENPGHVINVRMVFGELYFWDEGSGCPFRQTNIPRDREYLLWEVEDIRGDVLKRMKRDLSIRDDRGATDVGNFTSSCRDITLFTNVDRRDTVQLAAKCKKKRGSNLTGINLSAYIINSSGGFLWQKGGGFGGSARKCELRKSKRVTVLLCKAKDGKGKWKNAAINLDRRIFNDNGRLKVRL